MHVKSGTELMCNLNTSNLIKKLSRISAELSRGEKYVIKIQMTQPWESVTVIITCLVRSQDHVGIYHCQKALEHLLQLQQHQNEEEKINHALDITG